MAATSDAQSKLLYTAGSAANRPLTAATLNDAINAGADINWHCRAEKGRTMLHNISQLWEASRVRLLLQFGADPNALDETGNTPLHVAAGFCSAEVVMMLLKAGATVNALNRYQSSPLHAAAFSRNEAACRVLLTAGAEANAIDSDRRTALHWAAQHGSLEVCRLLLQTSTSSPPPSPLPPPPLPPPLPAAAPSPTTAAAPPLPPPLPLPPCDLSMRDDQLETAVACAAPASEVQRFLVGRAAVHSLLLCCSEWLVRNIARLPAAGAELRDPSRLPDELREYFARLTLPARGS